VLRQVADALPDAVADVSAVQSEIELACEGCRCRLDPLPDRLEQMLAWSGMGLR
jgi:hypothetical protein